MRRQREEITTADRAEALWTALNDVGLDAVITTDALGRIQSWNHNAARLYGRTESDAVGRSVTLLLPEDRHGLMLEVIRRTANGRAMTAMDATHVDRDGRNIDVRFSTRPIVTGDGAVQGALFLIRDATDGRINELKLEGSEMRFRLIGEGSPFGIFKADASGEIEYANSQWRRLMNVPPDESLKHDWSASIHPADRENVLGGWHRALRGKVELNCEFRLRDDDPPRWIRMNVKPLCAENRISFVGIAQDITQRKLWEERMADHARALQAANAHLEEQQRTLQETNDALVKAKSAAEEATRAKSEFLANMSHEIRTPMTAILGFTDILLDRRATPSELLDAAQTIRRNGSHLLQVINDILDVSKIEAGRMEVEQVHCSPFVIVEEVMELMRIRAEAKSLLLRHSFEGPIPSQIQTDPTRLRQILLNLVGNALKFTEVGSVSLKVQLDQSDKGRPRMIFKIVDTGVGLDASLKDRLFEPFIQADSSTTRRFGGTGLGLTISRRLTRMLGGDIDFESTPGVGSTFVATIEIGSLEGIELISVEESTFVSVPERSLAEVETEHRPNPLAGCRVLYAEDGPDNQRLIAHLLRAAGATVKVVDNGRLAVQEALLADSENQAFHVVLMDMQMPGLDGYQAARLLRTEGYSRPIIALTAHAMSTDRDKCISAGCTDFATKPIRRDELVAVVRHYYPSQSPEPK